MFNLPRSLARWVLAGAALASLPARADKVYRWYDQDGVLNISNVPKGGKSKAKLKADPDFSQYRPGPAAPMTFVEDDRTARFDPYIKEACHQYRIPPALVRAIMQAESNFDPQATSNKGALGLMQMMPGTATGMDRNAWLNWLNQSQAFSDAQKRQFISSDLMDRRTPDEILDPRQNIFWGVQYLRELTNRFEGDFVKVVAAYNAGPDAVLRAGGVPMIPETQDYVRKVMRYYFQYKMAAANAAAPDLEGTGTQAPSAR